jgi:ribose transport system ATP-binding protein
LNISSTSVTDTVVLEGKGLTNEKLSDINFEIHEGEIIGFYGLVGGGKTELSRVLFGLDDFSGKIKYRGEDLKVIPHNMVKKGIVLVPEERRTQGLFTSLTVKKNISVMNLKKLSKRGFLRRKQEDMVAKEYIDKLNIATSSAEKEVAFLSGGNQQKVVFAKCLFADSDILIMDEPTRGVDVGAKAEIYAIIRKLAGAGKSILFFSSELPEIINMCDRIFLLSDGVIKAEMKNETDIESEKILQIVTGG